jgi:acetyl-CoA carboxylase biotin carboxyl carrier protein
MQLDHDQLHRLLDRLADSDIQEFRLEGDDFRLEVRRNLPAPAAVAVMPSGAMPVAAPPSVPQVPLPVAPAPLTEIPSAPPPAAAASRGDLLEITAPMVATFYRSPAPGEPSFVDLGSRISVGQTVCILEAMKLMNELEAEVSGEVVEILVENGTPVEFGQVLMRVRPA